VKGGIIKMPKKERTIEKKRKYVGFELPEGVYKKLVEESNSLCLKPSSFAKMVIAQRYR
jgi:hypothetical protein